MPETSLFHLRRLLSSMALAFLLLCTGAAPASASTAESGWDEPFFETSGPALVSAANAVAKAEKGQIVVLLDEHNLTYDSEGRCTYRSRTVYRVMTAAAVKDASTVQINWDPWYQERPAFRARVVTPDGAEHRLAQETVSDAPVATAANIFNDRRIVRAPLPAVTAGAVVEREVVVREKIRPFAAGHDKNLSFPTGIRIMKGRIVIDYPHDLPLRHVTRLLPKVQPEKSEVDGRKRIVLEYGPLGPFVPGEPDTPGDLPAKAEVAVTTARSWSDIAAAYGEIVDRQIAGSDVSALVREVVGDERSREEIIRKLLARLQNDIRYTGIQFGSASIIPHTPEETLRNRYGDCKDQAVLLVKMLRTAGVPAHAALLRAGEGRDADADFPAVTVFNHAIVHVPGSPAFWIDTTDPFTPLGELPLPDQGRMALITDGASTALVPTPEAPSTANSEVEIREVFLSEQGLPKVTVKTTMSGAAASLQRRKWDGGEQAAIQKHMDKVAEKAYGAGKVTGLEYSSSRDVSAPFTLRFQVQDSRQGNTQGKEAVVAVPAVVLTAHNAALTEKAGKGESPVPRKSDYLLPMPHTAELRYRIVPPPGFAVQALPESRTLSIGAMRLEKEFKVEADGVVTATLRLDTVKRRYSPAEFQATREALKKIQAEKATPIRFRLVADSLLSSGNVREGLAELRRLSALHPKEALHHAQLAEALVRVGLTGAARKEAEEAIDLEPRSFLAHKTLGWVLQHDQIGRLRHKGYDRDGAIAAYRKAKALNPKDLTTRTQLAVLLEFDEEGQRYTRRADLAGAIAEYQEIRAEKKGSRHKDVNRNLLICLFRAERWKELKELALALEPSEETETSIVMAVAVEEGTAAAADQALSRITDPSRRGKVLETAANRLLKVRRYQEAAALIEEASKGRQNAASLRSKANLLKRVRRLEKVLAADEGPLTVVKKMLLTVNAPDSAPRYAPDFPDLFAPAIRKEAKREGTGSELIGDLELLRAKARGADELPPEVSTDILLSTADFRVEGNDAGGYRIRMTVPRKSQVSTYRYFVVREDGRYYLLNSGPSPSAVGFEILRLVESENLVAAKTLLDWIREEVLPERSDDPLAENPFLLLWPRDAAADAEQMRLAAAALLSDLRTRQAEPILLKGRPVATGDQLRGIEIALLKSWLVQKKYPELLDLCSKLSDRYPLSAKIFECRSIALLSKQRREEAKASADERLRRLPKDVMALRVLANVEVEQGRFGQGKSWMKMVDAAGMATAADYNDLAWLGLFDTSDVGDSLRDAERAMSLTAGENSAILHTLAALYAEAGKPAEAREMILKSIASDRGTPRSQDWLVLGRIAEEYGELEEAKGAYARVSEPETATGTTISPSALARKRLGQVAASSS